MKVKRGCAVQDTDDSERAIQWAIEELHQPGDVFHLLHVVPEPQMVHIWAGVYVPPDENAELLEVEDTKIFVSHRFANKLMGAKVRGRGQQRGCHVREEGPCLRQVQFCALFLGA